MLNRYDQLAKQMLRAGLETRGSFVSELEVSPDPQYIDGYFVPNLEHPSPIANTLLGRMSERTCTFEAFSSPPDVLDVVECLRKHFNLCHILRKQPNATETPHQWISSAGKPSSALEAVGAQPARDWPSGVYALPPAFTTSIIVLSELPEDRSTLLLRLMGRGRTLERAIKELKTLSDDDFEKCIALPLLVRLRLEVPSDDVSPTDKEFLMETRETFEMFQRRIELQGEQRGELRGELKGERKTVLRQLRRKFGTLPEDVVTRIQNADAALLEKLEDKVLFAQSLDEMFQG